MLSWLELIVSNGNPWPPIGRSFCIGFLRFWSFKHFSKSFLAVDFNDPNRISRTVSSNNKIASRIASWCPTFFGSKAKNHHYTYKDPELSLIGKKNPGNKFEPNLYLYHIDIDQYILLLKADRLLDILKILCTDPIRYPTHLSNSIFHPDSIPISGQESPSRKKNSQN